MYGSKPYGKEGQKMRQIRVIAVILCISMLLPLVFTSCKKDPETADELIQMTNEAMDAVGSYKQKIEMNLAVWVEDTQMSLDADGIGITIDTEDDYYYYNEMNMEMTVGDSKTPEKSASLAVYDDGRVYFLEESNKKVNKYASDATAEEYRAYLDENGEIDDYIYDCGTKEFSKKEDGSWELVLSDYTDKALGGMYEKAGLALLFDADSIKDIETEILVDEDFCVLEYELKFRFNEDEEGNKPQAVFKSEFSKHGEAERKDLDTEGYKNMNDLLEMKKLDRMLDEIITRESATVQLNIRQSITRHAYEIYNSAEYDKISYGISDGKFFYDMTSNINGQNMQIKYENGKQTISASDQKTTTASNDLIAKTTLAKILDCTGYEINSIKSFVNKGDEEYEVQLDKKNDESYKDVFGDGTELYDATLDVTYTVKDGKITMINASGEIKEKGFCTLDISIFMSVE